MTPQETRAAILARMKEEFYDDCRFIDLSEFPNRYGHDVVKFKVQRDIEKGWSVDLPFSINYSYNPPYVFFVPASEQESNSFDFKEVDHLFDWIKNNRGLFFKPQN